MKRKIIIKLNFIVAVFVLCFSCSSLNISIDEDTSYQWSEEQNEKEINDLLNHNDELVIVILRYNKEDKLHISNEVFNYADNLLVCDNKLRGEACKTFYVSNRTEIDIIINNKKLELPRSFVSKYKYLYIEWSGYESDNKYYLNFSNHYKSTLNPQSGTIVDVQYLKKIFKGNKLKAIKKM